ASLAVGRYLCFVKGDWKKGLPLVAQAAKEPLKALAEKDQGEPTTSAAQVKLGDAWYALSADEEPLAKRGMKLRAYRWYALATASLNGLTKERVDRRIAELEKLDLRSRDQSELYRTIRKAIQAKTIVETKAVGGGFATTPFLEVPPEGAVLIGFQVSFGTFV